MRRVPAALTAITVVVMLSGCTLLQSMGSSLQPDPTPTAITDHSCLAGMVGADSDRTATVDCTEPHLFEVTSMYTWPGMTDKIAEADGDLGAVWDAIHLLDETPENAEYVMWASRFCNEAAQRRVGIDDVEVDGHTAGDLWLRIGGTYHVDLSLASREKFVNDSDLTTVCSLAWYDESGQPRLLDSRPFEDLQLPGLPADLRECWARDYAAISCEQPHAAQVLLSFEGLEAFGPELIARVATGTGTEEDWNVANGFCEALLQQTLPPSADFGELGYLGDTAASDAWDGFDGTVDPDGGYWYSCVAVPFTDDDFTGDVLDGTADVAESGA